MGKHDGTDQVGLDLALNVVMFHASKWAKLPDACIVDEARFKVVGQFAKGKGSPSSALILRDVARYWNDRWCAQLHALR